MVVLLLRLTLDMLTRLSAGASTTILTGIVLGCSIESRTVESRIVGTVSRRGSYSSCCVCASHNTSPCSTAVRLSRPFLIRTGERRGRESPSRSNGRRSSPPNSARGESHQDRDGRSAHGDRPVSNGGLLAPVRMSKQHEQAWSGNSEDLMDSIAPDLRRAFAAFGLLRNVSEHWVRRVVRLVHV